MRHEEFAERAARCLEAMAGSLDERGRQQKLDVTKARTNELRVAALVVRDLSEAAAREEYGFPERASLRMLA